MWEGGSGDDVLLLAWAAVVGLFMKVILNAESQFLSLPPPVDLITEMCVLFEERLPTQLLLAQQVNYSVTTWVSPRQWKFIMWGGLYRIDEWIQRTSLSTA